MRLQDVILRGIRADQPAFGDVAVGTLYCVTDEDNIIERNSGAAWQEFGSDGTGDVVGPVGATDNALARFDGTTGLLLQNSLITLGDTGILGFPDDIRQTFNPGANAAGMNVGALAGDPASPSDGDLWYDSSGAALRARINGASVSLGAGGGEDTLGLSDIYNEFAYVGRGGTIAGIGATGSASTQGSPVVDNQARNSFTRFDTAAAAGAFAGFSPGGGFTEYFQTRHEGVVTLWIMTGSNISDIRYWIGVGQNNPSNSDTAPNNFIGFRYSTVAGDGGWVGVTKASGSQTVTSTVAAIAASTVYKLTITFTGTQMDFKVDNSSVQSSTTNLPSTTLSIGFQVFICPTVATSKSFYFSRCTCRYGN